MIARAFVDWGWILDHLDEIRDKVAEHLVLTGIALAVGLAISMVLALIGLLAQTYSSTALQIPIAT